MALAACQVQLLDTCLLCSYMSAQMNNKVTLSLAEIQIPGSCQQTDPEVSINLLVQDSLSAPCT